MPWSSGTLDDGARIRLFITDACMGLVESLAEFYPETKWQRCIVHFYRNVFSVVPAKWMAAVAAMLKAIHASEDKKAALEKAESVFAKLEAMKLKEAAKKVQDSIVETLTYYDFPSEHRIRIRTNNALERIMKEIRRRTRVVGAFPDGHSALMLCAARLRHIAGTQWGSNVTLAENLGANRFPSSDPGHRWRARTRLHLPADRLRRPT